VNKTRHDYNDLTKIMIYVVCKQLVFTVLGKSAMYPSHNGRSEINTAKPYPERLAELNLPSLEHRRARGDLVDVYNMSTASTTLTDHCELQLHEGRDTRGNSLKLAKGRCRLNIRASLFSVRIVSTWNSLPDSIVTAPSVNAFKNRLDKFWANLPSLYDPECYH
jgi:hypothetical protein